MWHIYMLYIATSKNEELDEKDVWLDQWLYMVWRQWGTKNTEGRTENLQQETQRKTSD